MRDALFELDVFENAAAGVKAVPYRNALNEVSRREYLVDCERGLARWNKWIERCGHAFRLTLPSLRFNRSIGSWAGVPTSPDGTLPSASDRAFVHSLMQPVVERGKIAAWIAPPDKGIKEKPVEYEYVRFA